MLTSSLALSTMRPTAEVGHGDGWHGGTGRSGRYGLALVGQNVLSRYPFSAPPSPGNSTNIWVLVSSIPPLLLAFTSIALTR